MCCYQYAYALSGYQPESVPGCHWNAAGLQSLLSYLPPAKQTNGQHMMKNLIKELVLTQGKGYVLNFRLKRVDVLIFKEITVEI